MKTLRFLFLLPVLGLLAPQFSQALYDKRLSRLYMEEKPGPLWVNADEWSACAQTVLSQLRNVEEEGLDAEDFAPLLSKLDTLDLDEPKERKEADRILSVAVLDYISDMKGERLYPRGVDRQLRYRQVEIDEVVLLQDFLAQGDQTCQWITQLAPNRQDYRTMKKLLAEYRQIQAQGGWPKLSSKGKLGKGTQGPQVEQLRQVLGAQGYLSSTEAQGSLYDAPLIKAVKRYQRLHGLDADGTVGPATRRALNTPVEKRIERIIVSMERQRWLPEDMGDRYIQVNIAGYELKAVEHDRVQFRMPIITGMHYRETPNYSTKMVGIRFNPSWHVPHNIAVQDKLPKLQRNPYAFSGRGYNYYDEYGGWINPAYIDWYSYSRGYFPFKIRQSPGPRNALGKIRFTLENKNGLAIFLHGTPAKHLWEKAKRSFSSGCIRVKNPPKLAEFVFNDPSKWSLDRINREASGYTTNNVRVPTPLNTHITYFTIWVDEEGETHFVDDVYGQDKQIWDALQQHRRRYRL